MAYCASRFHTVRRRTLEVKVGAVGVGGTNPLRIQSMTTSDTQDVAATVKQAIALAEVGCEIVRVTAPNVQAARCLRDIRREFTAAGFGHVPLVADIHFLPQAAMEAVEHVEKVRVNPGNYADKKKFAVRDYSDADYERELQRLHDAFSPLIKRSKELGRALRIGTNHGSLSDRIMNRYGDTPLGMVESALEFLRIAEAHAFNQLILSMKASNPKVMIQAYRLLVERMQQENMHYPLHLGVTEAGDGEDGRIKSAIGIGSLLLDGLGDTIRVSLTEDSVYEIPVARALADKAMSLWHGPDPAAETPSPTTPAEVVDPFHFEKRTTAPVSVTSEIAIGPELPPRVFVRAASVAKLASAFAQLGATTLTDTPAEGVLVPIASPAEISALNAIFPSLTGASRLLVLEVDEGLAPAEFLTLTSTTTPLGLLCRASPTAQTPFSAWRDLAAARGWLFIAALTPAQVAPLAGELTATNTHRLIVTLDDTSAAPARDDHAVGRYRRLFAALRQANITAPVWIRSTAATALQRDNSFLSRLLEASILTGALLCDGLGDLVSIETEADVARATKLAYNVLQGAGARISKTEFVACPSCGRTLFDLQSTTQRIRAQTGHLKGVKIAIMGCIVNGPGEMADADFGYVGGAPGKINLYVGKDCVQYNIPQTEADARLIALIKAHGKWQDPAQVVSGNP